MEERRYQDYRDDYNNAPSDRYFDKGQDASPHPEDKYYNDTSLGQDYQYDSYDNMSDIPQEVSHARDEYPYPSPNQTYNQVENVDDYYQTPHAPPQSQFQPKDEYYQDTYPQENYEHTIHYDDIKAHGDAQMQEPYYPRYDSHAHQQYRENIEHGHMQSAPYRKASHQNPNYDTHHEHIENRQREKTSKKKSGLSLNERLFNAKINSEKFIVLTLLAAVIFTALIIGIGWSLFSPSIPEDTIIEKSEITNNTPSNVNTSNNLVKPDDSDQLTLVYGNSTTTTSTNTAPLKSTPTPVRTKPVSSRTTPISTQTLKSSSPTPSAAKKVAPSTTGKWVSLYWIQIFSTTNKDRALQIKNDLSTQGISPTIVTKTINGSVYYRLRIGPYGNKAEGQKFLTWIQKNPEYKSAYISLTRTQQQ